MKTIAWLGALGGSLALIGCADATHPSPPGAAAPAYGTAAAAVAPACFYTRDIRNHPVGDDHTLYFNVNNRAVYRVELTGACLAGATSTDPIIIRNPPGSDTVCRPIDLDIGVHFSSMTNHCIVSNIVPMAPAEVAALPPKLRP